MRSDYLLYPEALEKIKQSGIEDRVEELKRSEDGIQYIGGIVFIDGIIGAVQELKEEGFYDELPQDFARKYKKTMNGILNKPEEFLWTIQMPTNTIREPCELEDLLLFTGELASRVLRPEEIWNYSKFGFSSPSEFITTIGAFIIQQSKRNTFLREGYKWTRKRDDGSEIVTEVTGDNHFDLRIYQTDIAPYPTIDPLGNTIEMRPETDADKHIVAASYSTEGTLLVAVMKYIEQQGIPAEYQKDGAKQLIEWGNSLGQSGGTCTEHFGGLNQNPMFFFGGYDIPIPQLNKANEADQHSNFWLTTTRESAYGAYIAHNGDFILSYQERNLMRDSVKPISARFLPNDAEHLVKGLIYQSAKGLGRTSARQLLDILAYRYSPQFEKNEKISKNISF
ncbi:MAG: hypothetical protein KAS15_02680 [Nanoarchaeota archaeon]|nr:hypothetical protein [Nanoarchaeota archaeon]